MYRDIDTYLVLEAFEAGHAEICQALLDFAHKQGKDIAVHENARVQTALHFAIEQDRVDLVKLLDFFGHNILHYENAHDSCTNACCYAARHGSYEVCEYYLQLQAIAKADRTEAFCMTVRRKDLPMCEMFLKYDETACSRPDVNESFPIHYAVEYNGVDMIKLLLDHGADINAQNADGSTALHLACISNSDVATYLVQRGADCEIEDANGMKPYYMGCYSCFAERGYPPLVLEEEYYKNESVNYLLLEELDANMTQVFARQEKSWFHQFSWIPIVQQRMRTGHCFITRNGATSAFYSLLQHEAVANNSDKATRQVAIDCLFALSEGALLAIISNANIAALLRLSTTQAMRANDE